MIEHGFMGLKHVIPQPQLTVVQVGLSAASHYQYPFRIYQYPYRIYQYPYRIYQYPYHRS